MSRQNPGASAPLEHLRDRIIELLSEYVVADTITLDEFEERVELVHRARSRPELERALAGLPRAEQSVESPEEETTSAIPSASVGRRESQTIAAILGGATRQGPWVPARRSTLFAIMGGIELDLREAILGMGTTEINAISILGGIEIIVPPDISVDCDGIGIMGGFDHQSMAPPGEGERPHLRIKGVSLLGGVEIRVRLPGETEREARKRLRRERAGERRALKGRRH